MIMFLLLLWEVYEMCFLSYTFHVSFSAPSFSLIVINVVHRSNVQLHSSGDMPNE